MSEDEDVAPRSAEHSRRRGSRSSRTPGRSTASTPPRRSPADLLTRRHCAPHRHNDRVVAVGWVANTAELNLPAAGVQTDQRGYVQVDAQLRTTAPHIFAAGDVTGHVMVVHEAAREAYLAATNAVLGTTTALPAEVSPLGSFTDPEYASVGLTETTARKTREVIVATQRFDSLPRPIIDGRPTGFCKLIADRQLPHHPRLPHRRRTRRRTRSASRDRDGSQHDGRATRARPLLVPHLRQRARTRSHQSGPRTRHPHRLRRGPASPTQPKPPHSPVNCTRAATGARPRARYKGRTPRRGRRRSVGAARAGRPGKRDAGGPTSARPPVPSDHARDRLALLRRVCAGPALHRSTTMLPLTPRSALRVGCPRARCRFCAAAVAGAARRAPAAPPESASAPPPCHLRPGTRRALARRSST